MKRLKNLWFVFLWFWIAVVVFAIFYRCKISRSWEVSTWNLIDLWLILFASLLFPGLLSKSLYHYQHIRSRFEKIVNEIEEQMNDLLDTVESLCTTNEIEEEDKKVQIQIWVRKLWNLIKNLLDYNENSKTIDQKFIQDLYNSFNWQFKDDTTEWASYQYWTDYLTIFDWSIQRNVGNYLTKIILEMDK